MTGRIRTLGALAAMVCWLVVLSACAGDHLKRRADRQTAGTSLADWLDEALIPYLLQQLSQHPRFKGQPLMLVRMHNDDVQPHIDELTDHIRTKIVDALVSEPGLNLYWRPATRPHKHHQSLADIACGDFRKIHYYIGIDCRLTSVEEKLEVRVRALNLTENKWVSGFGRSWQGHPTAAQQAALKREHPDAYLRGLRPLPFTDKQPDLLAAYLARNLSCLFQQGDADNLLVHVEEPSEASAVFFKTALKLVGRYLARFREVEVTDDPERANVAVAAAIHAIDRNMYQVWVSALDRRQKKYLPGAETEAYVLVEPHPQRLAEDSDADPPSRFAPRNRPGVRPRPLIAAFDLITPAVPDGCSGATPWRAGARRLHADERLPARSCLAVEIRLAAPAHIFLIAQDATGELTRLFPSDCRDFKALAPLLAPGRQFRFPPLSSAGKRVLELQGRPGLERVYALAVASPDLVHRLESRLDRLQGLCVPGRRFPKKIAARGPRHSYARVDRWHQHLTDLATRYPEEFEWREFRFWHDRSL